MSDRPRETSAAAGEAGTRRPFGISAALVTPFTDDGSVDVPRLVAHLDRVLASGAASGTLFGTTGEGSSLSLAERCTALADLIAAGVDPARLVVCVPASSIDEARSQIDDAARQGVTTVLLPPPYYFKGVPEDGVFAFYAGVLGGIADGAMRIILYHIPQVTAVPLSLALVQRIAAAFPGLVFGVKDSAGVLEDTRRLLAETDLAILVGDERQLAACSKLGASGSISGMANLFAGRLNEVLATGEDDADLNALVEAVVAEPVTPAVKALVAHATGDSGWRNVRAPLVETPPAAARGLATNMDAMSRDKAA